MSTTTLLNLMVNLLDQHQWLGYFINILLKSSAVIILVTLINLLLRKYSAAARHLIWAVTFFGLLCLPFIIKIVPVLEIAISEVEFALITQVQSQSLNENAQVLSDSIGSWSRYIQSTYFLVVFALFSYTLLGIYRIHLLTLESRPIDSTAQLNKLRKILTEEGIFSDIQILENDSILSPLSWGFHRPVILMPVQARDWSMEKLTNVLIHEVCHIQRMDWLSHLFGRIVCAMFWCNPLVWYAYRKFEEEAEQACDDAVVLYGRDRNEYATDLLDLARQVKGDGRRHILAQAIANSFLGSRVIAILDSGKVRSRTDGVWAIRALLTTLTLFAILASIQIVPEVKLVVINRTFNNLLSISYIPAEPDQATLLESPTPLFEKPLKESIIYASPMPTLARENPAVQLPENTGTDLSVLEQSAALPTADLNSARRNSAEEEMPTPLYRKTPIYPDYASQRGIEGYSIIEYDISPLGDVINSVVIESSPGSVFNRASLNALEGYTFTPPLLNGEVIGVNGLRTRFVYQLNPKPG